MMGKKTGGIEKPEEKKELTFTKKSNLTPNQVQTNGFSQAIVESMIPIASFFSASLFLFFLSVRGYRWLIA
jgi:hypothetical protein